MAKFFFKFRYFGFFSVGLGFLSAAVVKTDWLKNVRTVWNEDFLNRKESSGKNLENNFF